MTNHYDDEIMSASEALKVALLSAIDDEDASDEAVSEFIDTSFDQYNEHIGKLLAVDPRVEHEHAAAVVAKSFNQMIRGDGGGMAAKSFVECMTEDGMVKAESGAAVSTDAEDKARRRRKDKELAARRAAEQRATTKQERETEMAEIENPVAFAKAVLNNGHNPKMTKRDMYIDIAKRAEAQCLKGETEAQAFARYITKEPDGIALFSVHKILPGPDYEFERPEVTKADDAPSPSLDKLKQLAAAHQKTTGVTPEAAFAHVYTDPANRDLVAQHKTELAEQSSIDAARKWPDALHTFRPAGAPEHTARVS